MIRWLFAFLTLVYLGSCSEPESESSPFIGTWEGLLKIPAFDKPLELTIRAIEDGAPQILLSLPEEGIGKQAAEVVTWENGRVELAIDRLALFFNGRINQQGEEIAGALIRGRSRYPVTLHRRSAPDSGGAGGTWRGQLRYPAREMNWRLNISRGWRGQLTGTLSSPALRTSRIPVTDIQTNADHLILAADPLRARFEGFLASDSAVFSGQWRWESFPGTLPLTFRRVEIPRRYRYRMPGKLADGWESASLAEAGLDSAVIHALMNHLRLQSEEPLHSLIIAKNGRLVLEEYYAGYRAATRQDLSSATAGVTGLLTGIALERGWIAGIDTPILPFFPEYAPGANLDPAKRKITVEHLLTMTSGLACNDWSSTFLGNETKMLRGRNWSEIMLDLPVSFSPGEQWLYCAGNGLLLGEIITRAAERPLPDIAAEHFFTPLEIGEATWGFSPEGRAYGGGMLKLRARDMAKIASLVVNEGRWQGRQIVPADWIRRLSEPRVETWGTEAPAPEFGYLWWRRDFRVGNRTITALFAGGRRGPYLFAFPELDLVAVFTGEAAQLPFTALQEYLLPAAQVLPIPFIPPTQNETARPGSPAPAHRPSAAEKTDS